MKRYISRFFAVLCAALFLLCLFPMTETCADDDTYTRFCIANRQFSLRSGAYESSDEGIRISTNQVLPVIEITSNGWYKVKYESRSAAKVYTGYVSPDWADLCPDMSGVCEDAFEAEIAAFPNSYKPYLRALHRAKPDWHFVPGVSDLSFSAWVSVQSAASMGATEPTSNSFVYASYSGLYRHPSFHDQLTDGGTMYCASSEAVAYFMDPRNFLNEIDVFMFYQFDSGTRSVEAIREALSGSYLYGYAQDFHDVGEATGIDPYYLIVQAISENGVNGTPLSRGESKTVCDAAGCSDASHWEKSYYNFFGVGSTPGGSPQHNGLVYAIEHSWDTPYKALLGGSELLDRGYIKQGQNTPYYKKFNVGPGKGTSTAWHQWMQNIAHPESEANLLRKKFAEAGLVNQGYTFLIPVFADLPQYACALPLSSGSAAMPRLGIDSSGGSGGGSGSTPARKRADISGDGVIDTLDLLQMRKHLLGMLTLTGDSWTAADISGDGVVDTLDLLQLRKHLLGMITISG